MRAGVSLLRKILGKAILVMSGRGRMMYLCLEPKPEVTISSKRSKPQEVVSSPHDSDTSMAYLLEWIIQGDLVYPLAISARPGRDRPT